MGIWPWQCTPTGLDNSTELRMEKIHQAVTKIWVLQVWQPPARPQARPPGPWRQYPSSPEGQGVKTLQKELPVPNPLYWYGKRKLNIKHSRICMGRSSLNAHLSRHHYLDTPQCACGDPYKDPFHHLCACPRYIIERNALQNAVSVITNCSIRTLWYGSQSCTLEQNKTNIYIFHYVHNFIESTAQFK